MCTGGAKVWLVVVDSATDCVSLWNGGDDPVWYNFHRSWLGIICGIVSEKKVTFARPFSFALATERGESSSPDYFISSLGSLFRQNYFIII